MPRPHDFLAQQTLLTAVQATATAHTPLASKLGQVGVFFKVEGYSLSVLTASSQQLQNEKIKPKKSFLTTKKSPSVTEPMFSIVARFFLKNRRFFQKIAWSDFFQKSRLFREKKSPGIKSRDFLPIFSSMVH